MKIITQALAKKIAREAKDAAASYGSDRGIERRICDEIGDRLEPMGYKRSTVYSLNGLSVPEIAGSIYISAMDMRDPDAAESYRTKREAAVRARIAAYFHKS